ncbi:MAG TPA: amidohydrolase family protein [Longimicrobiales bacterium]
MGRIEKVKPGPLALLAAAVLAACAPGARDVSIPDGALVIRGGWLFDGVADEVVPNRGIVIEDSILRYVNVDLAGRELEGARVIDLTPEDYVIPGMFDLHAHYAVDLLGQGRVDEVRVYPALFLGNGVTSTFPAGEVNPERMRELRLRIERGEQAGPRLFNSGPYFGSAREGWDPEITPEQIRAEVDYWASQGARGFKAKGIRPEHLKALIEAAHAHGLTVTGHLGSGYRHSVNPRDAILMGIDRVEHFLGGDAMPADRPAYASLVEMTPEMPEFRRIVDLYKERGIYFDATLSAYGYFGRRDPEVYTYFAPEMDYLTPFAREQVERRLPRRVYEQFEQIYWVKRKLVKAFYDLGAGHLLTLGTDHPSWGEYFSGFAVHRELHAFVLAGIPPAYALKIATIHGARALGVDDRLGTLEPGKLADLVILEGNPLEDIRNTRNVRTVVKNGEVYDARQLLESVKGQLGPRGPEELADW